MTNPWKMIPLTDYEGHMALPTIGQADMLSDEFGLLLKQYPIKAAALIGCAGGNGFEQAVRAGCIRLVGIDINPDYIEAARQRYSRDIMSLELHCADIEGDIPQIDSVDLVFAALVFEYVDVLTALRNIKKICHAETTFGALLQMPSEADAISASAYSALRDLGSIMRLVSPMEFRTLAEQTGLYFQVERIIELPSGKRFSHQIFSASEKL